MLPIKKTLRTGTLTFAIAAGLFAQQTNPPSAGSTQPSTPQQTQGVGATEAQPANPGFGRQVPNDSATLSGGVPHDNSTYQKDRNGNQGIQLGWLGLLGLFGLVGLFGRVTKPEPTNNVNEISHSRV